MALAICYFTRAWIIDTPLSFYEADMLPIIKTMCQRFLNGEWSMVYQPIPELWSGIQPIYLPAMWIPFVFAVEGNFDLRWITAAGLFFSFSFFLILWNPVQKKILAHTVLAAAAIILWWLLTEPSHNFIRLTEEGVVVFYYCLLTLALLSENYLLIGLAAALCALSRYMLAGWFPAMILYLLLIKKQPKQLFIFLVTGTCVLLLLVIFPFGLQPIKISIDLPAQYIAHAERVWKDNPQYFFESMGLPNFSVQQAGIFYTAYYYLPHLSFPYHLYWVVLHGENGKRKSWPISHWHVLNLRL
ncbi:MAG: hypothetical protein V4557_00710 [Bacteroidota bacterium]